jgi:hypothetical protein
LPNSNICVVVAVGGGKGIQLNGAEKYNVRAIVPRNPHAEVKTIFETFIAV